MKRDVYIVDGCRTPFIKSLGKPNLLSATDLALSCLKSLITRQSFNATDIGEVIAGCVSPAADEANIGRIIALRLGCGFHVPGWTVQRNCASGLQAIDCAVKDIATGCHDLVLAGGTEAMSRTPLLYSDAMVNWFSEVNLAKKINKKLIKLLEFKPKFLVPVIALLKGLKDPVINMSMGQTAEKLAFQFGITRKDMDEFAVNSHIKASEAIKNKKLLNEIVPLFDWQGKVIETDNGIRSDSSIEKLSKLKPVFEKPFGSITAGNSSQITDGAAFLLLCSEKAIDQYNLSPIGRVVDISWAGLDPSIMGLGPAHAISKLLLNNELTVNNIDYWEINEAFAAQVIACLNALNNEDFCRQELGLTEVLGEIDKTRLNVNGGAIAFGHPVGASGARLALHLLRTLQHNKARMGIASLCVGGGQGGALLLENIKEGT